MAPTNSECEVLLASLSLLSTKHTQASLPVNSATVPARAGLQLVLSLTSGFQGPVPAQCQHHGPISWTLMPPGSCSGHTRISPSLSPDLGPRPADIVKSSHSRAPSIPQRHPSQCGPEKPAVGLSPIVSHPSTPGRSSPHTAPCPPCLSGHSYPAQHGLLTGHS